VAAVAWTSKTSEWSLRSVALHIAAGVNLLIPIRVILLIVPITLLIMAMEIWGSYRQIERIFKRLTLAQWPKLEEEPSWI